MSEPFIDASDLVYTQDDQVAWASARIREYCRWHIYPSVTETRTVSTTGGRVLVLPTLRLTALGTVVTHTVGMFNSTLTDATVDPTMLQFTPGGVVSRFDFLEWPDGIDTVTVTFTHGYAELPESLRAVAVSIATRIPRQMTGATVQIAGGVQMRYGNAVAFDPDEQAVLDAYRLPPRP